MGKIPGFLPGVTDIQDIEEIITDEYLLVLHENFMKMYGDLIVYVAVQLVSQGIAS